MATVFIVNFSCFIILGLFDISLLCLFSIVYNNKAVNFSWRYFSTFRPCKSRDKIQIVEKRKIDISYQFMYLPKFQLSNDDMKFER